MNSSADTESRMSVREALQVLVDHRDEATMVVTNQGASRVWPLLTDHTLDFHYNPSTMGGAIPLGLGLALAQPAMQVVVVSGDGALCMSLGSLISVIATGCRNITVVVLDNGIYEVTGGQTIAADVACVDYSALALAVGFRSAFTFDSAAAWRQQAGVVCTDSGPHFVALRVKDALPADLATPPVHMGAQLRRLADALGKSLGS